MEKGKGLGKIEKKYVQASPTEKKYENQNNNEISTRAPSQVINGSPEPNLKSVLKINLHPAFYDRSMNVTEGF